MIGLACGLIGVAAIVRRSLGQYDLHMPDYEDIL
jgi:hypothetical protein